MKVRLEYVSKLIVGGDDYNAACDYILNRFVSLNQSEVKQVRPVSLRDLIFRYTPISLAPQTPLKFVSSWPPSTVCRAICKVLRFRYHYPNQSP